MGSIKEAKDHTQEGRKPGTMRRTVTKVGRVQRLDYDTKLSLQGRRQVDAWGC